MSPAATAGIAAAATLGPLAVARLLKHLAPDLHVLPFLLRRTGWLAATLLVVFTLSFFLMRAVPGGPFDAEKALEPAVRRNLEARYELDRPLGEQYLGTLGNVMRLDLGPSMKLKDYRVGEVIAQGLPASAALGMAALVWTLLLGLPAGVLAAVHRGRRADRLLTAAATVGLAVPNFVLAGLLMIPLVFTWHLLSPAGLATPADLLLPSFCLGAPFAAQVARLTRTGMIEALSQEWVTAALARGLPWGRVLGAYALRSALIPVVTFLAPAAAGILTGSLVIERIFAIPGLGTYFVQSALNRDYPLAMGMILLFTLALFVLNALSEVLHRMLDPRVELR